MISCFSVSVMINMPCINCTDHSRARGPCLWTLHQVSDIRTVSGPGGRSGPLRVDLEGRWHGGPGHIMREYGEAEAKSAYHR